jgi:hypothetical protein
MDTEEYRKKIEEIAKAYNAATAQTIEPQFGYYTDPGDSPWGGYDST